MKRPLLFLAAFIGFAVVLPAAPTPAPGPSQTSKKEKKAAGPRRASETIGQSANGWSYVNGEWVHPDGYKYVKGQVLRTTAKAGRAAPEPPGKLAMENAEKLAPKANSTAASTKTPAEKASEARRKNLTPIAAPQTGSHL